MPDSRVLVVGTTADYIDLIDRRYPGRALFITDVRERSMARETPPLPGSELLCDLKDLAGFHTALVSHLEKWRQTVSGVTSYDCESMELASSLAERLGLPYPSTDAIRLVRDKLATKGRWQQEAVNGPRAALVTSEKEAAHFAADVRGPVVLKPLTGSGSELTFRCDRPDDCRSAFRLIKTGLARRADARMYASSSQAGQQPMIEIEEWLDGPEYSCDFIIDGETVQVIRVAAKLHSSRMPFGTTLAYLLPARLPGDLTEASLADKLRAAALAVGIRRAVCMVDFIVRDGQPYFLELTPRPGGDCLPPLIMQSCGLDMLGVALDFAEGKPISVPPASQWTHLVGLRLFACAAGRIGRLDASAVLTHPAVVECHFKRAPGHVVTLPPEDYDSWLLGHIIFRPSSHRLQESECLALASRIIVETETGHDYKLRGLRPASGRAAQTADSSAGSPRT
nr:ATP-grasp domain-containing protein [candidate division Zixibacteria bacterium]